MKIKKLLLIVFFVFVFIVFVVVSCDKGDFVVFEIINIGVSGIEILIDEKIEINLVSIVENSGSIGEFFIIENNINLIISNDDNN